jgi:hypothetical protein
MPSDLAMWQWIMGTAYELVDYTAPWTSLVVNKVQQSRHAVDVRELSSHLNSTCNRCVRKDRGNLDPQSRGNAQLLVLAWHDATAQDVAQGAVMDLGLLAQLSPAFAKFKQSR